PAPTCGRTRPSVPATGRARWSTTASCTWRTPTATSTPTRRRRESLIAFATRPHPRSGSARSGGDDAGRGVGGAGDAARCDDDVAAGDDDGAAQDEARVGAPRR